ncbi:MAG: acyl-ACP--UDP-N-acetylglucosamine O-acyltransferase [Planctomycetota bacterium]|nr:acyl-ACP--UDP-N-acetylglucosamine O-acyltransferase [Planctomycetota bacterium]
MPKIHPTAIIDGDVELADDVEIGPRCTISGTVSIGSGSRLVGDCWITGPTRIGSGNVIYPFTTIGFTPQSRSVDPGHESPGVLIGNDNVIREHVTINRALTNEAPTTLGNNNYIMAQAHAGHDTQVGNNVTMANSVQLAGHTIVEDHVNIGGGTCVHQFVRLGFGAMLSGGAATTHDVLPWFVITATNIAASVNLVGMRRLGMSAEEIAMVRWVFKIINRRGLSVPTAIDEIRQRATETRDPVLQRITDFLDRSERPICTAFHSRSRSGYDARPTT